MPQNSRCKFVEPLLPTCSLGAPLVTLKPSVDIFIVRPKPVPKNLYSTLSAMCQKRHSVDIRTLQLLQWQMDVRASSGDCKSTSYRIWPQ